MAVSQVLDSRSCTPGLAFPVKAVLHSGMATVEGYPDLSFGLAVEFFLRDVH
jgi:hypothetical protein